MEWTEVTACIEEGIFITLFEVMIKGGGVGELEKLKSVRLVDKRQASMPLIWIQIFIIGNGKPGVCREEKWFTPQGLHEG